MSAGRQLMRKPATAIGRRVISIAGASAPPGTSPAVAAGGWLFGGGLIAADLDSGLDRAARSRPLPWSEEPLGTESRLVLERLGSLLAAAGCDELSPQEFAGLQAAGVFLSDVRLVRGELLEPGGLRVSARIGSPEERAAIAPMLGDHLRDGVLADAGFFLGPRSF